MIMIMMGMMIIMRRRTYRMYDEDLLAVFEVS